jgi:hypothetical protein
LLGIKMGWSVRGEAVLVGKILGCAIVVKGKEVE